MSYRITEKEMPRNRGSDADQRFSSWRQAVPLPFQQARGHRTAAIATKTQTIRAREGGGNLRKGS